MVKQFASPAAALSGLIEGVTAKWAKQRKAEERSANARGRRNYVMMRSRRITVKEAAARVLDHAYAVASAGGTLPANPRQIYYAARGPILEMTGESRLDSQYFCQTVLNDYIDEHDVEWDIAWDDRGHFREPHTNHTIGLGTLAVRNYLRRNAAPDLEEAGFADAKLSTSGPNGRYGAVLFIEKEGFWPLFEASGVAERYDLAIMSSKGMSVTAARELVDKLYGDHDVPVFVLHDFDIAGFSILQTLGSDSRRYRFKNKIKIIDLGLRLADVERLGLESEAVEIRHDLEKLRDRLAINGATEAEIEYLLDGERVELNAMASDVFIRFIEDKFAEHGVKKVVPNKELLEDTYRLFARSKRIGEIVEEAIANFDGVENIVPVDLEDRVRELLNDNPVVTWDEVVRR